MSEPNPYEATAHLSEIHGKAWKAWRADRLPADARWRSDGRIMVRRDAVEDGRMERIQYEAADFLPMVDDDRAETVLQLYTEAPIYELHVVELVDVTGLDHRERDYDVLAVLRRPSGDGETVYVNAHKLRLACYWTRADQMMGDDPTDGVVLYRDGEPVAVVMPLRESAAAADVQAVKDDLREAGS